MAEVVIAPATDEDVAFVRTSSASLRSFPARTTGVGDECVDLGEPVCAYVVAVAVEEPVVGQRPLRGGPQLLIGPSQRVGQERVVLGEVGVEQLRVVRGVEGGLRAAERRAST
ncbi:hypothetical protein [Streptomyces sp. NPDC020951]|uniref:hypothetical protein n=1 Tax=Streptomyces sp. NPDC020951 TaxID=3365104 RepID=UPI0037966AEC